MSLDDLRMFEVRLPVHSWRYIYDLLKGETAESVADLRRQLETGVPFAPFTRQCVCDGGGGVLHNGGPACTSRLPDAEWTDSMHVDYTSPEDRWIEENS